MRTPEQWIDAATADWLDSVHGSDRPFILAAMKAAQEEARQEERARIVALLRRTDWTVEIKRDGQTVRLPLDLRSIAAEIEETG